jgi:hypothetical protein
MRQAVRAVALACSFVTVTAAASARAQSTLVEPPSSPQFMTRFDFEIVANALSGDDPHISWAMSTSWCAVRSRRSSASMPAIGETYRVDEDVAGRGQQWGGRIEGGVRLAGRGGAFDLFGGFERMIDADPLDRVTRQWAPAGIRLTGM